MDPESVNENCELAGPNELAEAVVELLSDSRHFTGDTAPRVSNDSVRRIVKLAYYASQLTEEGYYTQVALVIGRRGDLTTLAKFEEPIPLESPKTLQKLAPAVSYPGRALLVSEEPDQETLQIVGTCVTTLEGTDSRVGRPEILGRSTGSEIIVWADAPGTLRVSVPGSLDLRLSGGHIRGEAWWIVVQHCQKIFEPLSKKIIETSVDVAGDAARTFFGGSHGVHTLLVSIWSQVLFATITRKRGGAFIFLPELSMDSLNSDYGITAGRELCGKQLCDEIAAFWAHCVKCNNNESETILNRDADRWLEMRKTLITRTKSLADLSAVDGCVVLNYNLDVYRMGAHIDVDTEQQPPYPLTHSDGTKVDFKERLSGYGMRHNSAATFCCHHANVTAFVVSQDGELTVFASDDKRSYMYGPLVAWDRTTDYH